MPDTTAATGPAAAARTLAITLMGSLVFIVLALWFVLGAKDGALETPPVMILAGQLVAGAVIHLLIENVGYRAAALSHSLGPDEVSRRATAAWSTTTPLRFALGEAVAITSVALAFIVPHGGFVVAAVGAAVSLVLLLVHVWPGPRPVDKLATSLERDGQPSGLREAFGHAAHGPIQEL